MTSNNKGGSVVELIVVVAIIGGSLAAILGLVALSLVSSGIARQTQEAVFLAQEAMEALRNYRDGVPWDQDDPLNQYDGFEYVNFALNPFHLEKSTDSPPQWKLVSGAETVGIFTREIIMEFAHRDANDDIVPSGTQDPDTLAILVRVSWQERGRTHTVEIASYLTNWK
ncbi:MAG TPA: type II secretion system protein [Candidatus Paceibacterota bacterium]|nr:type II secretion system protein [Candidatus Paceibacterota bacterium]